MDSREILGSKLRAADDDIYLNEDRYEKPKEYFKVLADILKSSNIPEGGSLLDIGCATGEFLFYAKKALPGVKKFTGIDVSEKMISYAREKVPGVDFISGSILDGSLFTNRVYDAVVSCGLPTAFDDVWQPISNMLSCSRYGGVVVILGIFNNDPVDMITRYKRADKPGHDWEIGWNIVSTFTVDNLLNKSSYNLSWEWIPFRIPFSLSKKADDPMRAWTIETQYDKHQHVNGACQILYYKYLKITLNGQRI